MIFLSAQPYDLYFLWQLEVQIENFREHNISDKMHVCVWTLKPDHKEYYVYESLKENWKAIVKKYPEVKFFFYENELDDISLYIPQLRPHILKKHFKKYKYLENEVIFYHDSDIIFNRLPNFDLLLKDNINWQSDTTSYLDYKYLRSKEIQGKIPEHEAIKTLADIGGVSVDTFIAYNNKTGGAQYIFKNIDYTFWEDVEKMSVEIRKKFFFGQPDSINRKYFSSEEAGFQSWCADMWAVNMALWKRGKITNITSELDFSWATDNYETFLKKPIYHNAGATSLSPKQGIFFKGMFIEEKPFRYNFDYVNKKSASYQYVKLFEKLKL